MAVLFRLHQKAALQASRRLSWLFWAGVVFSGAVYVLAAYAGLVFALFYVIGSGGIETLGQAVQQWALKVAFVLALIPVGTLLLVYLDRRRELLQEDAVKQAEKLGAVALDKQDARQRRLDNVVMELAVASGVAVPPVFVLARDGRINACVLGGRGESVALVVSMGALVHLSRAELQALVAHEFGHIVAEDVFVYARLAAMLQGYFVISQWRDGWGQERISSSRMQFLDVDGKMLVVEFFASIFALLGGVLLLVGRALQGAFSRQREWMADARALEYVRDSVALAGVFKKALALEQVKEVNVVRYREAMAHFFFINYESGVGFLAGSTHPPLVERLRRCGGVVEAREIAALVYELKNNLLALGRRKDESHKAGIQRQAVYGLGALAGSYQQDFIQEVGYPILVVQRYLAAAVEQAQGLGDEVDKTEISALVFAMFVFHARASWFDLTQSKRVNQMRLSQARAAVAKMGEVHPVAQLRVFASLCAHLKDCSASEKRALLSDVAVVMDLDGRRSFYEWCCWVVLVEGLSRREAVREPLHYQQLQAELARVLGFLACVFAQSPEEAEAIFARLCEQSLPIKGAGFEWVDWQQAEVWRRLRADLLTLRGLQRSFAEMLLAGLEEGLASLEQPDLQAIFAFELVRILLRE